MKYRYKAVLLILFKTSSNLYNFLDIDRSILFIDSILSSILVCL